MLKPLLFSVLFCATLLSGAARAEEVVNVYTSRHYDIDDAVYKAFTDKTGIKVNLIEGDSDALLARLKREGALSPADVFLTVDAARLHRAVEQGIFAPITEKSLLDRVPADLRHPQGLWIGLTKRARVLIVSRDRVKEGEVTKYADLADPKLKGKVLVRSGNNAYNQSLVASLIATEGGDKAAAWVKGLVANLARKPQGGDRDQIRGVAAGEGDVAVSNHYYFVQMLRGDQADRDAAAKVRLVFPDQDGRGTHVNISGAGILKTSKNRANAVKLLEHLTSPEAQSTFAVANGEYPVVDGVELSPELKSFGTFKSNGVNGATLGENNRQAVRMMDEAGWR